MLLFLLLLAGVVLWLIANYWLKTLFFNNRFFWVSGTIVILFLVSFFYPVLFEPVRILLFVFVLLFITDILFLFGFGGKPAAKRRIDERMSNCDNNPVVLEVKNS